MRLRHERGSYLVAGGSMSLMMNNVSPGLMRPNSRRAISSMAAGSSRNRRASSRKPAFSDSQARQLQRQLVILFSRSNRGEQPLIADQGIDNEDARDEKKDAGQNTAAALRALIGLRLEGLRLAIIALLLIQHFRL